MSKIDDLIKSLCPDGVEWLQIGKIINYIQPSKYIVKSTNYSNNYKTAVLTPNKSFILGYTNETEGVYFCSKSEPIILFDDFTCLFRWVDFPFKVKSSACKILLPFNRNKINFRFIYFLMKTFKVKSTEHVRNWISRVSKIDIPIPPLSVQNKIVEILDRFTEMEKEIKMKLETEMEKRITQYEYYRNKLLTFDENTTTEKLENFVQITKGKQLNKQLLSTNWSNEFPFPVINGGREPSGYWNEYNCKENEITISEGGASAGYVQWHNNKFYAGGHCYVIEIVSNKINKKFLYYLLKNFENYLMNFQNGAAIPSVNSRIIKNLDIPIPPLSVQNKIVEILDKFSELVSNFNEGIPKEIELRHKQYEYYRDKLLTFKIKE